MSHTHVIVLAAGKRTRVKASGPIALWALSGRPLIHHVLDTIHQCEVSSTTVVVAEDDHDVQAAAVHVSPTVQVAPQAGRLGTGHAVLAARSFFANALGTLVVVAADMPLLSAGTLNRLCEKQRGSAAAAAALMTMPEGRVESGTYAFALDGFFAALNQHARELDGKNLDLVELVALFRRNGRRVESLDPGTPVECRRIETMLDLAELTGVVRQRKNRGLLLSGVSLDDPATTYIDEDVLVGPDTWIAASVHLEGQTRIGSECRIHAGVRVTNSAIGDRVTLLDHSVIVDSAVGDDARVGPFAHVRPQSIVGPRAHVGNFVELKKTSLGAGSKANHLAYLGDATIGVDTNIGAGTITCNYDGERKHPTIIGDRVFVGSDSQLIAPVCVGDGAYVAAGSSITKDVPADSLAVARARQVNKDGWVKRRKENES